MIQLYWKNHETLKVGVDLFLLTILFLLIFYYYHYSIFYILDLFDFDLIASYIVLLLKQALKLKEREEEKKEKRKKKKEKRKKKKEKRKKKKEKRKRKKKERKKRKRKKKKRKKKLTYEILTFTWLQLNIEQMVYFESGTLCSVGEYFVPTNKIGIDDWLSLISITISWSSYYWWLIEYRIFHLK